ncbi:hypothetical protein BH23VER1_BH23VER1_12170 [soil metagenome]
MRLVKLEGGDFELREIDDSDLRILAAVPREADPTGHPSAEDRLFPDPLAEHDRPGETADPGGTASENDGIPEEAERFLDDWHSYVRPDLKEAFDGAVAVFAADLRRAEPDPEPEGGRYRLRVPAQHAGAWLSTLNQARLVMNAKHQFPESDDLRDLAQLVVSGKLEPFLLNRFYAEIQEWLIYHYL